MTGGRIAVFLDRDGTLNEEIDFLRRPDELRLIPGAAHAVRQLNVLGVLTCVISNQSGVARGIITENDLIPIHARLEEELARDGAWIDRIYYCPHHPTEGVPPYNIVCDCRKPKPGMLRRAEAEFGIDLGHSFVIGDRAADILAGKAVNATTALVLTGYGSSSVGDFTRDDIRPDRVAPSIVEAIEFIRERISHESTSNE